MPSTYTLNNGIELIGTGEQSGSWGDTTNTNFELIDTALDGQVTVTLASAGTSGSPNALPISDGASSDGRNRMIIFNDGADLGATAYVQLTPNDAEKIVYIRNDLSGSRSIIVFQGTYSASNDYEIPAGTTAVIYFNGGGAGAVAANVFNNAYFDSLRLGGVSVTAIIDDDTMATAAATNIPTAESVKAYVDAQVGANNELSEVLANGNTTGGTDIAVSTGDDITFADNSKAIFGAGSDLQIYHTGSNSVITDAGTGSLYLGGDNNVIITSSDLGTTKARFTTTDVELYYAGAEKLATTSTGIAVTGDATFADNGKAIFGAGSDLQIYHDGSNSYIVDSGVGGLYVQGNGLIQLQEYGGSEIYAQFLRNDAVNLFFDNSKKLATTSTGVDVTGTVTADGLTVDGAGEFKQTSSGGEVKPLRVTNSSTTTGSSASLVFNLSTVSADQAKIEAKRTNSPISSDTELNFYQVSNGAMTLRQKIATNGDISFYEDTGTTPKFFWDASAERLGIGTTTPASPIDIYASASGTHLRLTYPAVRTWNVGTQSGGSFAIRDANAASDRMTITTAGNVGIGTSSPQSDLEIQSKTTGTDAVISLTAAGTRRYQIKALTSVGALAFVDESLASERMRITSTGNVGIGDSTPDAKLHVAVTGASTGLSEVSRFERFTSGDNAYLRILVDNANNLVQYDSSGSQSGSHVFLAGNTERMRITSTGSVGIGTSSPAQPLTIQATTPIIQLVDSNLSTRVANIGGDNGNVTIDIDPAQTAAASFFSVNVDNSEAIRVDQVGNLLIGTTQTPLTLLNSSTEEGIGIEKANSYLAISRSTSVTTYLNRLGSDGDIVQFRRDGTTVGSIGSRSSEPYLASTNYGLRVRSASANIIPVDSNGATTSDGVVTLGQNVYRFKDLHLSGTAYAGTSVGIGTTNPSAPLDVVGSPGTLAEFRDGVAANFIVETSGAVTTIGNQAGSSQLAFKSSNSEAMRIDGNGNVGIGTSSPGAKLEVASSTMGDNFIRLNGDANSGTNYGVTLAKIQANWIGDPNWASINFEDERTSGTGTHRSGISFTTRNGNNAGSERMRINSAGNLLVGTTSGVAFGDSKIQIEGPSAGWGLGIDVNATSGAYGAIGITFASGSTSYIARFDVSGSGTIGTISQNGTSTSYNTSSDYRLKEDVQPMVGASDRVLALNPVNFAWKVNGTRVDGFIAHEAQAVVPEAVTGEKDAVDADGKPVYQGIDQSKLVPLLTAALQEALTEIAALKDRVAALEA